MRHAPLNPAESKLESAPESKSDSAPFIHPTSIIDEGVSIGKGSRIWHFCHILSGSVIGANCSFGQGCSIGANVSIGAGVRVQNNVSIFEGVRVEEEVFIGPSVVFTNILSPRAFISRKNEYRPTLIERRASIGANATILCGITIGAYALIGAGSVVLRDVPPHSLQVGNPARHIGWVDKAGVRLHFDSHNRAIDSYDGTTYTLQEGRLVVLDSHTALESSTTKSTQNTESNHIESNPAKSSHPAPSHADSKEQR